VSRSGGEHGGVPGLGNSNARKFAFEQLAAAQGSLTLLLSRAAPGTNDVITMKAEDNGDTLTLMFENEKQDRISDVDLKLMSIESEHLGIPDQDYSAKSSMPASEYQRIVRDLASIGDTVSISATKEGIKFSTSGDIGTANITLRCERAGAGAKELCPEPCLCLPDSLLAMSSRHSTLLAGNRRQRTRRRRTSPST
jgi:hypothetical protein